MSSSSTLTLPLTVATAPAAARAVFRLLQRLRHGTLTVQLPDGPTLTFGHAADGALRASIRLHRWTPCAAALKSGDIGFAESFIDGDWSTPDLPTLLRLFIANRDDIEAVIYGGRWGSLLHRARHLLNRNSRRGSAKNIHAHYDLGNEFYRLWLDPTMNYSSAWFDGDLGRALPQAQDAKVRRALRECGVRPGDRVLEIGCGWGALAETAAREFGATVTGVTLSREQLAWGRQRLADVGLPGELRYQDYRDIDDGPFDAIASIEMFEAVGERYWPVYFDTLRERLAPGGSGVLQVITIAEDYFDRYRGSTDFVQRFIFPGGKLPSVSAMAAHAERAGLRLQTAESFGASYALTLAEWRRRFHAAWPAIAALGYDDAFRRLWAYYLCYCEAGFRSGRVDVGLFRFSHAAAS